MIYHFGGSGFTNPILRRAINLGNRNWYTYAKATVINIYNQVIRPDEGGALHLCCESTSSAVTVVACLSAAEMEGVVAFPLHHA